MNASHPEVSKSYQLYLENLERAILERKRKEAQKGDRRRQQIPVEVERRSGIDRRGQHRKPAA